MKTSTTPSGNLNRERVQATPEMGARAVKGKSNEADGNLIDPPKAEPVTEVDVDANKGACVAARKVQSGPEDSDRRTMRNSPDSPGSI